MSDSNQSQENLSREDLLRYERHLILPEIGIQGQSRIKASRILVIGAGGLGSPALLYLAAAGVGTIGIVDDDKVEKSNLQRQVLHADQFSGKMKVDSAIDTLKRNNPYTEFVSHPIRIHSTNAMNLVDQYDMVLDGSDNFPTRYLMNDVCVLKNKPYVYGSVLRFEGQCTVFHHNHGPCYRCLYPQPPKPGMVPNCAESGVLGVLPGIIGTIQATECLKIILSQGETLAGRLLAFNALNMRFTEMKLRKNPACPVCGTSPVITKPIDYEQFCGITPHSGLEEIEPKLVQKLQTKPGFLLVDVREPFETSICRIQNSKLLPLSQLKQGKMDFLEQHNKDTEIVLYCKAGKRSLQALEILKKHGFENLRSMSGGILAWAEQCDPEMPKY